MSGRERDWDQAHEHETKIHRSLSGSKSYPSPASRLGVGTCLHRPHCLPNAAALAVGYPHDAPRSEVVLQGRSADKLAAVEAGFRARLGGHPAVQVAVESNLDRAIDGAAIVVNQVRIGGLAARGVTCCRVTNFCDQEVADHTMALVYACLRGVVMLDDPPQLELNKKHYIDVVVDRIKVGGDLKNRLAESFETA